MQWDVQHRVLWGRGADLLLAGLQGLKGITMEFSQAPQSLGHVNVAYA